jgi:hypothetical protein
VNRRSSSWRSSRRRARALCLPMSLLTRGRVTCTPSSAALRSRSTALASAAGSIRGCCWLRGRR